MFQLDPRTVIFVNFIYIFCISIFIIVSVFLEKYRFKGFINWIIAFLLLSLNFLILSLRNIIPLSIVIIVPHIMAVWAYIEIKRGLSIFYEIKNRIFTDFIIIAVFAITLITNDSNARLRMTSLCIASILVFIDIILLFNSKPAKEKINNKTISILFSIAGFIMGVRLVLGLQWDPRGNPLESGNNLSTISILFFITNIVIFFSLLFIVLNKMLVERNELVEKISAVALTDELTGLMNRRGFKNVTDYELKRLSRTNKGFTFVMGDIDHFKKVNDIYGHDCGDSVLKIISEILQHNMRGGDTAARWGGEEFVILLPETNLEKSENALQRIKSEIEQYSFEYNGEVFNKTMSFGACYCNNSKIDIESVIQEADKNLYDAKESGRNKIKASSLTT